MIVIFCLFVQLKFNFVSLSGIYEVGSSAPKNAGTFHHPQQPHSYHRLPIVIQFLGFIKIAVALRAKFVNFNCNVFPYQFHFCYLTEAWLINNFFDYELGLTNYNNLMGNRCRETGNYMYGGVRISIC